MPLAEEFNINFEMAKLGYNRSHCEMFNRLVSLLQQFPSQFGIAFSAQIIIKINKF
jgi:hypothetical protein